MVVTNLNGWAMIQSLPYDDNIFKENAELEDILNNEDDSDIGYILEVGLKYPNEIKENPNYFPICHEAKFSPQYVFSDYMIKTQLKRILHEKN